MLAMLAAIYTGSNIVLLIISVLLILAGLYFQWKGRTHESVWVLYALLILWILIPAITSG